MNISAVVLTKNEERNIAACLKGLAFCDEILVIDDGSNDKTHKIAKSYGAKVYIRELEGDFARQRNFGQDMAKGRWILFVDADERVSQELQEEIVKETSRENNPYSGYYLKREDYLWGKKLCYGETTNLKFLRLARKGAGRWKRRVHEFWRIVGRTRTLKNPLLHYPHQTLREFISDINFHSTLHAKANLEEGKSSNLLKIMFYPKLKFFRNYILRLGFLDAEAGFVVALLMSFHSFLAWSKLWLMQRK
ncbi:MAG: glycosyltransferase family 2 protein [Patescibacteria group bacterium]